MPNVNCIICKSEFYVKPSHQQRGWGKYCSRKCQFIGQKTGNVVKCDTCGKGVYKNKRALKASRTKKYFCNKSCLAVWKNKNVLMGENHVNWKYGENAYRAIMIRNNIRPICNICGIEDKRVLVVHHMDQNRKNNKLKNLKWLCRNCHYLEHRGKTL